MGCSAQSKLRLCKVAAHYTETSGKGVVAVFDVRIGADAGFVVGGIIVAEAPFTYGITENVISIVNSHVDGSVIDNTAGPETGLSAHLGRKGLSANLGGDGDLARNGDITYTVGSVSEFALVNGSLKAVGGYCPLYAVVVILNVEVGDKSVLIRISAGYIKTVVVKIKLENIGRAGFDGNNVTGSHTVNGIALPTDRLVTGKNLVRCIGSQPAAVKIVEFSNSPAFDG